MLISRCTASEQPVEWAHSPKMAKQLFLQVLQFFYKIREF